MTLEAYLEIGLVGLFLSVCFTIHYGVNCAIDDRNCAKKFGYNIKGLFFFWILTCIFFILSVVASVFMLIIFWEKVS